MSSDQCWVQSKPKLLHFVIPKLCYFKTVHPLLTPSSLQLNDRIRDTDDLSSDFTNYFCYGTLPRVIPSQSFKTPLRPKFTYNFTHTRMLLLVRLFIILIIFSQICACIQQVRPVQINSRPKNANEMLSVKKIISDSNLWISVVGSAPIAHRVSTLQVT